MTGQTLLKNKRLSFQKHETLLKDGAGTQTYFPKIKDSPRRALKVAKANGNEISYDYKKMDSNRCYHHYISKIKIDREGKRLNRLNLKAGKVGNDSKLLVVSHKGLQLASYRYDRVKYEWFDHEDREWLKEEQYLLKSVKRHQMPPENYFYESLREPHPEPKKLIRKELPRGSFSRDRLFSQRG